MAKERTVLVVEDNAVTRRMLGLALEEAGYRVVLAADAASAMAAAESQWPDIVLQDLILPDMSGFELVERLRKLPGGRHGIILAFTGFAAPDEDRRIAEAPFDGLIVKPAVPSRIIATIEDYLRKSATPVERNRRAGKRQDSSRLKSRRQNAGLDDAQRIELQVSALGVLGTIADALSHRQDVDTALCDALAQSIDAAGLSRGAILLTEPDGSYRCRAQIGFEPGDAVDKLIGTDLLPELRRRGAPMVLTADTATTPEALKLLTGAGASSVLLAPIAWGQEEFGVLLLTSAFRTFTGDEWRGFVRAIAAQLGQAMALQRAFLDLQDFGRRYRSLFENIPVGLMRTTPQGRVIEANRAAQQVFGYANREELLARNAHELYVDPEARSRLVETLAREREVRAFPARMRRRDGTIIDVEISVTAVMSDKGEIDYFEGSFSDVTERRGAEASLREAEGRFRQIADNIKEVFFVTDATTGHSLYLSPAFEEIFGRTRESAMSAPHGWLEGMHPDDRERIRASIQPDLESDGQTNVFRVIRPDGEIRWVRSRIFPVRGSGNELRRVVGVAEDITELRQTEQQLIQSQKMEAVGQLAGGIAHDFNNLLAVIMMFTELVSDDLPENDPHRDDLAQVQQAVQRAQGLTRQLLAFSKRQVLQPVVLDPSANITDLAKMLGRLIGEDVELVLDLRPDLGTILVDPGQLEQVVMNLAVNARDAMPSGGRLTFATRREGREIALTVSDNGTGMSEAVCARAFEPFFTTKEGKGTGLGLATVLGIVQQSGGRIDLASELGKGTTFTIHFPATDGEVRPSSPPMPQDVHGGTETVLVVEDDRAVREVAALVLRRFGYAVLEAKNGIEGLTLADKHAGTIHLVLSDIVMPGMDGRDFARRVRHKRPSSRILLMSGYPGESATSKNPLDSDIPLIRKPFTPRGLAQKVRAVLDDTGTSGPSGPEASGEGTPM